MCTGIAERVTLVSSTRPACVRRLDFQVGILAATVSTNACSSDRLSLLSDSGIPRYLHGNGATTHGNASWTAAIIASVQRIGVVTHLSMLVIRPDSPANRLRICCTQLRSSDVGATRITKSSAYRLKEGWRSSCSSDVGSRCAARLVARKAKQQNQMPFCNVQALCLYLTNFVRS